MGAHVDLFLTRSREGETNARSVVVTGPVPILQRARDALQRIGLAEKLGVTS